MDIISLPRKINYKTFAILLILVSFVLLTLWHCLYFKPLIDDCSLGFLGVHQIYTEKNQLRQVISYILLSLFTAAIFIYYLRKWLSIIKYFHNIVRLYIKQKLFASRHNKLYDPLQIAYSRGIINPKIYSIH